MLKDGILCFVAFLDVFSTKKWLPKKHKKVSTPGPSPPYLGLSPKFNQFFLVEFSTQKLLNIQFESSSLHSFSEERKRALR